jgi:hypothetical protein
MYRKLYWAIIWRTVTERQGMQGHNAWRVNHLASNSLPPVRKCRVPDITLIAVYGLNFQSLEISNLESDSSAQIGPRTGSPDHTEQTGSLHCCYGSPVRSLRFTDPRAPSTRETQGIPFPPAIKNRSPHPNARVLVTPGTSAREPQLSFEPSLSTRR